MDLLRHRKVTARRLAAGRARSSARGVHPARTVALAFVVLCGTGTLLLMLPGMTVHGRRAGISDALFTSVSASCVTGLAVVDTATYWSRAGQAVIMLLVQVGGFGIMTLGTLAVILVSRRIGLQTRLATTTETGTLELGALRGIVTGLAIITVIVESIVTVTLTLRMWLGYGSPLPEAAWTGLFTAVSSFNNAGFALSSTSLTEYRDDVLVLAPISVAIVLGGLGFPVLLELTRRAIGRRRPSARRRATGALARRAKDLAGSLHSALDPTTAERHGLRGPIPLSLHTRLTLGGTLGLLIIGLVGFALFEWSNPDTLGGQSLWNRLSQAFFSGAVTPRTAGFNIVNYAEVRPETRLLTDALMFIGGGSASTAGGIKVTTLMVLGLAVATEVRGHRDVNALDRSIPFTTVRIALAVTMVSAAAVMVATLAMMTLTSLSLDLALFESISALATVGLSADVTPQLPQSAQFLLITLMLLGRVGPVTLFSALSLRTSERRYRLPEGRPLVG